MKKVVLSSLALSLFAVACGPQHPMVGPGGYDPSHHHPTTTVDAGTPADMTQQIPPVKFGEVELIIDGKKGLKTESLYDTVPGFTDVARYYLLANNTANQVELQNFSIKGKITGNNPADSILIRAFWSNNDGKSFSLIGEVSTNEAQLSSTAGVPFYPLKGIPVRSSGIGTRLSFQAMRSSLTGLPIGASKLYFSSMKIVDGSASVFKSDLPKTDYSTSESEIVLKP